MVILTSCVGVNKTLQQSHQHLNSENLSILNGRYSNLANESDSLHKISLWYQFNFLKKDTFNQCEKYEIELEVINHKRISAKLWKDSTLIDEKLIKGKIVEGSFLVKRQLEVIGLPFIYFFYTDSKYQISCNKNENLILNRSTTSYGNIFIMSSGGTTESLLKFDKIKSS